MCGQLFLVFGSQLCPDGSLLGSSQRVCGIPCLMGTEDVEDRSSSSLPPAQERGHWLLLLEAGPAFIHSFHEDGSMHHESEDAGPGGFVDSIWEPCDSFGSPVRNSLSPES